MGLRKVHIWYRKALNAITLVFVVGAISSLLSTDLFSNVTGMGNTACASVPGVSLRNQVGVSIPGHRLIFQDQADTIKDLDAVDALGVTWLRLDINWDQLEANSTGTATNYDKLDFVIEQARMRDLKVLGILNGMPKWYRPPSTHWNYSPKTEQHYVDFASYAARVATRYKGKVATWEVWNEPNLEFFWANPNPEDYAKLLEETYKSIRNVDPTTPVIAGGTGGAWASPNDIGSVEFYERLYATGANRYFDAAAEHPYTNNVLADSGGMKTAKAIRAIMDRNGDGEKPIWGTETGVTTGGLYSATEEKAAQLIPQIIDTWTGIHHHGPVFIHTLRNQEGSANREDFFGLMVFRWNKKPAYNSLQAALVEISVPSTVTVRSIPKNPKIDVSVSTSTLKPKATQNDLNVPMPIPSSDVSTTPESGDVAITKQSVPIPEVFLSKQEIGLAGTC